jgi:hypothetical protein
MKKRGHIFIYQLDGPFKRQKRGQVLAPIFLDLNPRCWRCDNSKAQGLAADRFYAMLCIGWDPEAITRTKGELLSLHLSLSHARHDEIAMFSPLVHIQLRLAAWMNLCDKQNEPRCAQILRLDESL